MTTKREQLELEIAERVEAVRTARERVERHESEAAHAKQLLIDRQQILGRARCALDLYRGSPQEAEDLAAEAKI